MKTPIVERRAARSFETTQWSLVLAAAQSQELGAHEALGELCGRYWTPLYLYARRRGQTREEAEDATQEFFAQLIDKHVLRSVRRERGRFRSFLLACFRHFLADRRDHARAAKRGGKRPLVALDAASLEGKLPAALIESLTPEAVFERRWALVVLESALEEVRKDYLESEAEPVFDALRGTLTEASGRAPYRDFAKRLGMSEGAVRVAVHRLRKRYGRALRVEVARTVLDPAEVDGELRHLLEVLST